LGDKRKSKGSSLCSTGRPSEFPTLANRPVYFWDQLVAVALTNPEVCQWNIDPETGLGRSYHVSVVTEPSNTHGQTIENPTGESIKVCTSANAEAFYSVFISVLATE